MPHSSGVPMDRAVLGSPCRARAAERKRMGTMIDAGIRALVQMFSPPFRWVLLPLALVEGMKTALLAVLVYIIAVPFLLFAGAGVIIFFLASAYLLGREYFELAAMRHQPVAQAKRLRREHQNAVFLAGILIA